MKRKILITNDDGINSEGLQRLALSASKFGEVWIVAPDCQRSGCSHSETLHQPIYLDQADYPIKSVHAYSCTGTPADCIKAGIRVLMKEEPDVILTGINEGHNCGYDLQYSGTVGAAMEGSNKKSVSIALSEGKAGNHEISMLYLEKILELLIDHHPGINKIWNVNFPECKPEEFNGIRENCTVSKTANLIDHFSVKGDEKHMQISVQGIAGKEPEEGSDLRAVRDRCISISRISNIG